MSSKHLKFYKFKILLNLQKQLNWFDLKIEILTFFRSCKINIEEPTKQTSQIIQKLNLILNFQA